VGVAWLLRPRLLPGAFALNGLQRRLLVAALLAAGAADLDLLAPDGYVPSAVGEEWARALFDAIPELVLVEAWDAARAQLRPLTVRRVPRHPVAPPRPRFGHPPPPPRGPDPGLPPWAERTPVLQTPLGPLLQSFAAWVGTSGGFAVSGPRWGG